MDLGGRVAMIIETRCEKNGKKVVEEEEEEEEEGWAKEHRGIYRDRG